MCSVWELLFIPWNIWTIVTVVFIHAPEACEPDWIVYERFGVCYKLFLSPQLQWSSAKHYCIRQNAMLTDLYDHKEQMFIKEKLIKKTSGHGVWAGASDIAKNDVWRWVDNTKMDIDKFEWWKGNPNNGKVPDLLVSLFNGEDCLEISLKAEHRGQLNDYKCDKKMPFVCKKKDTPTTVSPNTTHNVTSHSSSEADDESATIPVVSTVVSLSIMALLVTGIVILLRRKRKQKSSRHYYEDANVTPPANENFYTCLEASNQMKPQRDAACPAVNNITIDDSSFHEYHSVYFPAIQSRPVTAKNKSADIESGSGYLNPTALKKY